MPPGRSSFCVRGRPSMSKPSVQTSPTSGAWLTALAASTPGRARSRSTRRRRMRRAGSGRPRPSPAPIPTATARRAGRSPDRSPRLRRGCAARGRRRPAGRAPAPARRPRTRRAAAPRGRGRSCRAQRGDRRCRPRRLPAPAPGRRRGRSTIDTPSVKASAEPSTAMSAARGRSGGAIAATRARRTPPAPGPTTPLSAREQQALGQQLPHDRDRGRAEREAHRDLALPRRARAPAAGARRWRRRSAARSRPRRAAPSRPRRVSPTTRSLSGTTCTFAVGVGIAASRRA